MTDYLPISPPFRVFIVDDHKFIGELLAHRLVTDQNIRVVGIANTASAALSYISDQDVDIVLVDMEIGDEDGVDLARRMLTIEPALRIVGLSTHAQSHYPMALLETGGRGFISKRASATEIVEGVRRVARGDLAISADVAYYFATEMKEPGPLNRLRALTGKETDILRLLSTGCSVDEIAGRLEISPKTVQSHRASMKKKLELSTDVELCLLALRAGIVRIHDQK